MKLHLLSKVRIVPVISIEFILTFVINCFDLMIDLEDPSRLFPQSVIL